MRVPPKEGVGDSAEVSHIRAYSRIGRKLDDDVRSHLCERGPVWKQASNQLPALSFHHRGLKKQINCDGAQYSAFHLHDFSLYMSVQLLSLRDELEFASEDFRVYPGLEQPNCPPLCFADGAAAVENAHFDQHSLKALQQGQRGL